MAGDYHSNSDAMDIDPISETVTNGFEDDTNKKLEFPCSSVSTHVFPFSLSHFQFSFLGNLRGWRFLAILSFEHGKSYR